MQPGPGPLERLTSWALPHPCRCPEAKFWGRACRDRNGSWPLSLSQHCKQASPALVSWRDAHSRGVHPGSLVGDTGRREP